jgi:hypothetical protein
MEPLAPSKLCPHANVVSKLYNSDSTPSLIYHPLQGLIVLLKEESGVKLSYPLFVPRILKLKSANEIMSFSCFNDFVEVGVLLALHVFPI